MWALICWCFSCSVFPLQFFVLRLQIFVQGLQPCVIFQYLFVFYLICFDNCFASVIHFIHIWSFLHCFELVRALNILNSIGTWSSSLGFLVLWHPSFRFWAFLEIVGILRLRPTLALLHLHGRFLFFLLLLLRTLFTVEKLILIIFLPRRRYTSFFQIWFHIQKY